MVHYWLKNVAESSSFFLLAGRGQNRGQPLLSLQRNWRADEVPVRHYWRQVGHRAGKIGGKSIGSQRFAFTVFLLSDLTVRWEQAIYWNLIFLLLIQISIQPVFRQQPEMKRKLIPVLLKSKRITPDFITQYCRSTTALLLFFCFCSLFSLIYSALKFILSSYLLQRLWSRHQQRHQPVHHDPAAARRKEGGHGGRFGCWTWGGRASLSRRRSGTRAAAPSHVAQQQRANGQPLCCHIEGQHTGG